MGRRRGADVVAEAGWLAQAGESPQNWPVRLGMSAEAIGRACYRAGRLDLARPMWRLVEAARRRARAIERKVGKERSA